MHSLAPFDVCLKVSAYVANLAAFLVTRNKVEYAGRVN